MRKNVKGNKAAPAAKGTKKTGTTAQAKPFVTKTASSSSTGSGGARKTTSGKFTDYCDPKTKLIQQGK